MTTIQVTFTTDEYNSILKALTRARLESEDRANNDLYFREYRDQMYSDVKAFLSLEEKIQSSKEVM